MNGRRIIVHHDPYYLRGVRGDIGKINGCNRHMIAFIFLNINCDEVGGCFVRKLAS